jgi:hypothetical protein
VLHPVLALLSAAFCLGVAVWGLPRHRPPTRLRSLSLRLIAAAVAVVSLVAVALIPPPPQRMIPTAVPNSWEATVYLPLADDAGQTFPEPAWDAALAELVRPFGGGTLGEPQEGCWVDANGRLVRERVRPVVISFPAEEAEAFREAVRRLRDQLSQEAVYVRFEDQRVELIR